MLLRKYYLMKITKYLTLGRIRVRNRWKFITKYIIFFTTLDVITEQSELTFNNEMINVNK